MGIPFISRLTQDFDSIATELAEQSGCWGSLALRLGRLGFRVRGVILGLLEYIDYLVRFNTTALSVVYSSYVHLDRSAVGGIRVFIRKRATRKTWILDLHRYLTRCTW